MCKYSRLFIVCVPQKQLLFSYIALLCILCLAGCRDEFFYNVVTQNNSEQEMYQCEMTGWKQRVVWGGATGGVTTSVPNSITITWKTIKPGKEEILDQHKEESERLFEEYVKATENFTKDAPHPDIKEPEGIYDEHIAVLALKGKVPKRPNGEIIITYVGDEQFEVEFKRDNGGVKDSDMKSQNVVIEDGVLDLGFSKITDKGLAYLENTEEILGLNLQGTAISDAGLKYLSRYPNLQGINLRYAEITGQGFENVKLDSLEQLILEQTTIENQYLGNLSNFKNMESLVLLRTNISDISGLANLKKLRILFLNSTYVDDAGLKEIEKLESLEELVLSCTNISDEGVKYLTGLKNLQFLYIDETNISDVAVETLSAMSSLRYLSLPATHITDKAIEYIPKFPQLEKVNLRGASISIECLKDLKQRCPDLEILTDEEI